MKSTFFCSHLLEIAYIIPITAGILYFIFSIPSVDDGFTYYIPNFWYRLLVKTILLITVLFIVCVLLIRRVKNCYEF